MSLLESLLDELSVSLNTLDLTEANESIKHKLEFVETELKSASEAVPFEIEKIVNFLNADSLACLGFCFVT